MVTILNHCTVVPTGTKNLNQNITNFLTFSLLTAVLAFRAFYGTLKLFFHNTEKCVKITRKCQITSKFASNMNVKFQQNQLKKYCENTPKK